MGLCQVIGVVINIYQRVPSLMNLPLNSEIQPTLNAFLRVAVFLKSAKERTQPGFVLTENSAVRTLRMFREENLNVAKSLFHIFSVGGPEVFPVIDQLLTSDRSLAADWIPSPTSSILHGIFRECFDEFVERCFVVPNFCAT